MRRPKRGAATAPLPTLSCRPAFATVAALEATNTSC